MDGQYPRKIIGIRGHALRAQKTTLISLHGARQLLMSFAALLFAFAGRAESQRSVILISVDTLRADRLGCYGSKGPATLHIDAIAEGGTRFSHVYSQVPLTLPSHTSLLTSTFPFSNGVRDNGQTLSPGAATLATALHEQGYRTAAFVASFVLDRRFGLSQGFDVYNGLPLSRESNVTDPGDLKRSGEEVIKAAVGWVDQNRNAPFFLFLHLYDLHTPYSIPGRNDRLSYSDVLAYEDTAIGKFWEELRTQQILDHALVVFVADHGEGLGDHRESTHGYFVYQSTIHVPLIMHWPKNTSFPAVINASAGLIDVAPTVLDYLGIQKPASFQGDSLLQEIKSKGEELRTVYSESLYAERHFGCSSLRSIQDSKYKYIDSPKPELYNVVDDPGEQMNVFPTHHEIASAYRDRLRLITSRFPRPSSATVSPLSGDAISKLRSLGYLAGATTRPDETLSRPAPSDRIDDYEIYHRALALSKRGHSQEAITTLGQILGRHPDLIDARLSLGLLQETKQLYLPAAQQFREVLKWDPTNALAHCDLAICLLGLGKRAEAMRELEVALTFEPNYTHVEELLAAQLIADNRLVDGRRHLKHILKNEPNNFQANYSLGALAVADRRLDDAKAYLTVAVQANPHSGDAHNLLGSVQFMEGELAWAEGEFKEAIRLAPRLSMAHYNLGLVLEKSGNRTAAVEQFRQALDCDPNNAAARQALREN